MARRYNSFTSGMDASTYGTLGCFGFWVAMIVAWITHVVYCIATSNWILLVIGALAFPIGMIHGVMVWFGAGQ